MAKNQERMAKKEIALWAEKRLDALLAITFVTDLKQLRSRAEKLEYAEAELDDTCEYLAESVVTLLTRGRRASPAKRDAVKAMLTLRAYDFFKVGDRILCILESEEAKTLAHLMGPEVVQEVHDFVADRRCLFPAHKPN